MAKRFTDTEKWKQEWWQEADHKTQITWFYLLDNCDPSGVWEINIPLLNFQTKNQWSKKMFLDAFKGRVIEIKSNKIFILKFIEFQYGALSQDCNPHKRVIMTLKHHGIPEGYLKGTLRVLSTLEEEEEEEEEDKEEEKEKVQKEKNSNAKSLKTKGAVAELSEFSEILFGVDQELQYFWLKNFEKSILLAELFKIKQWSIGNSKRFQAKKDFNRFFANWLKELPKKRLEGEWITLT